MTKQEFLMRLDRALADLPLEERRQHLRYYRELIDDMMEDGLDESDAVDRLGDVYAIADSILQNAAAEADIYTEKHGGYSTRNIVLCVGVLLLCVVVTCIKVATGLYGINSYGGASEETEVTVEDVAPYTEIFGSVYPDLADYEAWDNPYSSDGYYTISADGVQALDIKWAAGDVNIYPYDGEEIVIMEDAVSRDEALRWGLRDGCLYIQYCAADTAGSVPEKYLDIQMPYQLAESLASLEVSGVSASVTLGELWVHQLELETVSGDLYAYGVNGEVLDVSTVSGWVDIMGSFFDVRLESTSGEVNYYGEQCPETLEAELVSGDLYLNIPEGDGFTLAFETVSGELYDGFNLSQTMDGDEYVIRTGSGAAEITVETVSGDLNLNPMYVE